MKLVAPPPAAPGAAACPVQLNKPDAPATAARPPPHPFAADMQGARFPKVAADPSHPRRLVATDDIASDGEAPLPR